ncbi:hypothetical protein CDL15_Pgr028820 [Punica granatum]|uniref:Uncharacterized protein n=1 Tax=Punica granatum TaxID=22663 RepID=A0A218XH58_PUNGR|nr:hypothetical protein CDL15_Pgr028820 [Punica granatum]
MALELLIVSPWRKGEDHERSTCKGADLPPHSGFERARPRKAPVLDEGLAEISMLECMCGPPRAIFLDLSRAAFAQASS